MDHSFLSKIPEIAKDFVENFYKLFDHARHMLNEIYHPNAKIVWDGTPVPFPGSFDQFYKATIPISSHDVRSVDCQPIPSQNGTYIVVNASGFVSFGSSNPRPFTENFVIVFANTDNGIEGRIATDCFRLLA